MRNLPKISLMEGSPLNRADLRAVNVNLCRTCILLSSKPPDKLEPVLADKENHGEENRLNLKDEEILEEDEDGRSCILDSFFIFWKCCQSIPVSIDIAIVKKNDQRKD